MWKEMLRLRLHTPRDSNKAAKAAIKYPLYASFEWDAPPALRATPLRAGEVGFADGKEWKKVEPIRPQT